MTKARQLAEWQLQPGPAPNPFLLGKGTQSINLDPALNPGGKAALQVPICQDAAEGITRLMRKLAKVAALPEPKSVVDTVTLKQIGEEEQNVFTSYGHNNHSGYSGVLF